MDGVRPTKRCLSDLGLSFPSLDVPLVEIAHDLIVKSQSLPEVHAAGGAERVRVLVDRLWFKVKVGEYRGVAGEVGTEAGVERAKWWLGAAGLRRADSRDHDFYVRLGAECTRAAAGSDAGVSSDHLLPKDVDIKRLVAEQAALEVRAIRRVVREAIHQSVREGRAIATSARGQRLVAWVRSKDGDTYLAIIAEGFLEPRAIAVVLDAVPGTNADDWTAEPGEVLGIQPGTGQIVYSAIIPPTSLAEILEG